MNQEFDHLRFIAGAGHKFADYSQMDVLAEQWAVAEIEKLKAENARLKQEISDLWQQSRHPVEDV